MEVYIDPREVGVSPWRYLKEGDNIQDVAITNFSHRAKIGVSPVSCSTNLRPLVGIKPTTVKDRVFGHREEPSPWMKLIKEPNLHDLARSHGAQWRPHKEARELRT